MIRYKWKENSEGEFILVCGGTHNYRLGLERDGSYTKLTLYKDSEEHAACEISLDSDEENILDGVEVPESFIDSARKDWTRTSIIPNDMNEWSEEGDENEHILEGKFQNMALWICFDSDDEEYEASALLRCCDNQLDVGLGFFSSEEDAIAAMKTFIREFSAMARDTFPVDG